MPLPYQNKTLDTIDRFNETFRMANAIKKKLTKANEDCNSIDFCNDTSLFTTLETCFSTVNTFHISIQCQQYMNEFCCRLLFGGTSNAAMHIVMNNLFRDCVRATHSHFQYAFQLPAEPPAVPGWNTRKEYNTIMSKHLSFSFYEHQASTARLVWLNRARKLLDSHRSTLDKLTCGESPNSSFQNRSAEALLFALDEDTRDQLIEILHPSFPGNHTTGSRSYTLPLATQLDEEGDSDCEESGSAYPGSAMEEWKYDNENIVRLRDVALSSLNCTKLGEYVEF